MPVAAAQPDRLGDGLRVVAEAVLEVGADGQVGCRRDLGDVREHLLAPDLVVQHAGGEREARARRRERLEAELREHARRADVPGIRDDECLRARVQRAEGFGFLGLRLHARSSVQMPMAMNPAPATYFSVAGLTYCDTRPPASTPMPVARISAAEAARKTVSLLTARSEAKSSVASCVLSPSSASRTDREYGGEQLQVHQASFETSVGLRGCRIRPTSAITRPIAEIATDSLSQMPAPFM